MFDDKLKAEITHLLKSHKESWVKNTDRGDLLPTTLVIRGGQIIAAIIAREMNKNLGLKAAAMARSIFSAEALVLACDAHCYVADDEKSYEEARASWPDGLMQNACDQHGACDTDPRMSDCLSIVYAHENGSVEMQSMTYDYHGKDGGIPFNWTKHPGQDVIKELDTTKLSGYMVDNMRTIMKRPKEDDTMNMLAKACGLNDPLLIRFHADLGGATVMEFAGFIVMFQIRRDRAHLFLEKKLIDQSTYDKVMAKT